MNVDEWDSTGTKIMSTKYDKKDIGDHLYWFLKGNFNLNLSIELNKNLINKKIKSFKLNDEKTSFLF